ncbi:MAG: 4-hydroxybenzoate polyprenyltransferase [Bacteroidia bacterium]
MGLLTWLELTGNWLHAPLFIFIFGSTLVVYNMNMISGLSDLRNSGTKSERHHWCMNNEVLMKSTVAFGLLLSGVSVWFLNEAIWFLIIPLGLVAFAYTIPVARKEANKIRIREIGLWKIFIIASVWTGMTVILPAVNLYGFKQIFELGSWQLAFGRFLFILAITIPFDIRDLANDANKGVRTIPYIIGWKLSVLCSHVLLVAFILLIWFRLGAHHPFFVGYAISTAITIILVAVASPNRSDFYCSFWLEGTMLLQFMVVLLLWF